MSMLKALMKGLHGHITFLFHQGVGATKLTMLALMRIKASCSSVVVNVNTRRCSFPPTTTLTSNLRPIKRLL